MILKLFSAQLCAFQWTKVKRCVGRVFYHFTIFGFKNAKINFSKKIRLGNSRLGHLLNLTIREDRILEDDFFHS